jgi:Putative adhesin
VRHFALVALLALFSVSARADEWSRSYPVTGKPELVVDANYGDVEVMVGSSQQVDVRVTTQGGAIKDDVQITGNQSGNRVEIKLRKVGHACVGLCIQSMRIEVRVPRESDLNVKTDDGNVSVANVKGNLQFETGDGEVTLRGVEGSVHADTHDGNVDVNGRFDVLNLHTGDGNIDAEVNATSAPQPGWLLRSGDGNIRLKLPANLGADLDAQSGDGEIRVGFPISASGVGKDNSMRGKINGGGISIELRTGDGDIKVEKI